MRTVHNSTPQPPHYKIVLAYGGNFEYFNCRHFKHAYTIYQLDLLRLTRDSSVTLIDCFYWKSSTESNEMI
jgi:hypothetical protein